MNDIYYKKYQEKASEFWSLQQLDKTDEEIEYDKLINELRGMLVDFRDQIEKLENENEELHNRIGDPAGVYAEYQQLREEAEQLQKLERDIRKYQNQ